MTDYAFGADLSLNHGALYLSKRRAYGSDGNLFRWKEIGLCYYTTVAGSILGQLSKEQKANVAPGFRFSAKRTPEAKSVGLGKEAYKVFRLAWISDWLEKSVEFLARGNSDFESSTVYWAQEGYATQANYQSHQLGEVGAVGRLFSWNNGFLSRIHDPTSVKMFTTGSGTASKEDMRDAVLRDFERDFSPYNGKSTKNTEVSEDLTDAFALCKFLECELDVRLGLKSLAELTAAQRRPFLRTTKTYPENLLDRPFTNPEDVQGLL